MENQTFDFYLNTRVKFGCGDRRYVLEILKAEKWNRIGVVVDHNLLELPIIKDLIDQMQRSTAFLVLGKCSVSEPSYDELEDMRPKFADPTLQAVIGIGGGSALDMAKAMAVFVHNRKPAIEYRGFDRMTEFVLPIIAIPTTAGTGSEITPNASFIDSLEKKKNGN